MDKLIDLVFGHADEAHRAHLESTSFAEHDALGEFYNAVREKLDTFVESAIGLDVPLPENSGDPIIELEQGLIDLGEMRDVVCQDNPTLLNQFDELTGVYTRALFKLKRLA